MAPSLSDRIDTLRQDYIAKLSALAEDTLRQFHTNNRAEVRIASENLLQDEKLPAITRVRLLLSLASTDKFVDYEVMFKRLDEARKCMIKMTPLELATTEAGTAQKTLQEMYEWLVKAEDGEQEEEEVEEEVAAVTVTQEDRIKPEAQAEENKLDPAEEALEQQVRDDAEEERRREREEDARKQREHEAEAEQRRPKRKRKQSEDGADADSGRRQRPRAKVSSGGFTLTDDPKELSWAEREAARLAPLLACEATTQVEIDGPAPIRDGRVPPAM